MARQVEAKKIPREFEDALQMAGFGKFNMLILLACGGWLMGLIVETISMSFVIPPAQCDLNLSLQERGVLYSISFMGVVVSAHFWGYLADTRGRRKILIFSLFSSASISLICSIVPWSWLFIILRFLNGALIGGPSSVIYAFAGEFHDAVHRPKVITWISTSVALANMYLPIMSWILLPMEWRFEMPLLGIFFRPWRLLVILCTVPSITFGIILCCLPESPKYLLTQKKGDEVLKILTKMFCINTGRTPEEYAVSEIIWEEHEHIDHKEKEGIIASMWKQTTPLFKKLHLRDTIFVCMMHFGIFFSNSAIMMWFPEIVNSLSEHAKAVPENMVGLCNSIEYYENQKIFYEFEEEYNITDFERQTKICKDTVNTEVFMVSLAVSAAYAVAYIVAGFVINAVGKKSIIIGFLTVTSICGVIAQNIHGFYYNLVLIGIFVMCAVLIGVINAIVVDLYPTQIRAMALSIALLAGRVGAMAGSNIAGPLFYSFCDYLFYILGGVQLMVIVVTILLRSNKQEKTIEG